jgi:hypothetical protein
MRGMTKQLPEHKPCHSRGQASFAVIIQQCHLLREHNPDHILKAEGPALGHRVMTVRMPVGLSTNPTRNVRIHCAEAVRRNIAPYLKLFVEINTFHIEFDQTHDEFQMVPADTTTVIFHKCELCQKLGKHM